MRGDGHRGPRCSAGVILTTLGTDQSVGPEALGKPVRVSGAIALPPLPRHRSALPDTPLRMPRNAGWLNLDIL
jgi:hypothetical protein